MKFLTLLLVILAISLTFVSAFEDTLETDTPQLEDQHLLENENEEEHTNDHHEENTEELEPAQEKENLSKDETAALEQQENTEEVKALDNKVLDAEVFDGALPGEAVAPVAVEATTVPSVIKVLLVIFGSIGGFFMFMLPMGVIVTFLSTLFVAYQKKQIKEHQNKQNSIKASIENVTVDYTSLDEKIIPGASN